MKDKTYCYVREQDLKDVSYKKRIRIYFEYDNTETDRRVYVERGTDCGEDAHILALKVAEGLKMNVRVVSEVEQVLYTMSIFCLRKYYLVINENTNKKSKPEAVVGAEC